MKDSQENLVGAELDAVEHNAARLGCLAVYATDFGNFTDERRFQPVRREATWQTLTDKEQGYILHEVSLLVELEHCVPRPGWAPRLSKEAYDALFDVLDAYHDALPIGSGEWRWFTNVPREGEDISLADLDLNRMKATVISDGKQREVTGEQLVVRYWDWRRGGGEFSGENTYDIVRQHLAQLAVLIPLKSGLPE